MSKPKTATKKPPAATVTMKDAGFHLGVLGALLEAELVTESALERHGKAIAKALEALDEFDEVGRLTLALEHFHKFPLPAAKLKKIESLDFDGGNEVYMTFEDIAGTNSGGETEVYSVQSLDGIAALVNLQRLDLDSHGCPAQDELRDLSPLAGMAALEEIMLCDCTNADALLTLPKLRRIRLLGDVTVEPDNVLAELKKRGVTVEKL
ncbi:MAG: hypothetical protein U0271_19920 [Polyangiaceae bacterium]